MNYRLLSSFGLMAASVVTGAVVANAPDTLPYLWEWKAATVSLTGVAGLLLNFFNPPKSAPQ